MLAAEGLAGVAGILEGGVDALQEQTLLGVHHLRFARGDVEEERIELLDAVDEPAPLAVALAELAFLGIEVLAVVPAREGDFGDAVHPREQVLPVLLERVGLRVAAA